jgi:hypothetical protein
LALSWFLLKSHQLWATPGLPPIITRQSSQSILPSQTKAAADVYDFSLDISIRFVNHLFGSS